jgi:hypothetical protein
LDPWRGRISGEIAWTSGVTGLLDRQDIGETGHLEKLDFRRDWNLEETGHLRAKHLEKLDSRRNGTPGVTRTLERLDP